MKIFFGTREDILQHLQSYAFLIIPNWRNILVSILLHVARVLTCITANIRIYNKAFSGMFTERTTLGGTVFSSLLNCGLEHSYNN